MTEVVADHRDIHAGLKERYGAAVAKNMGADSITVSSSRRMKKVSGEEGAEGVELARA